MASHDISFFLLCDHVGGGMKSEYTFIKLCLLGSIPYSEEWNQDRACRII
jgi:hypothetical protein